VHYHPYAVDQDILQKSLACFIGTHDFAAFCTDGSNKSTVCTIDAITLEFNERYQAYCIEVTGKRFLHHMVRRIVGSALKVSSFKRCSVEMITAALQSGVSNSSLPKAPACGLHLQAIYYQD
jgi:tRNA pseudouridine38-40 synthase